MIKTLEQINQEFLEECVLIGPEPQPEQTKPFTDNTERWVEETLAILRAVDGSAGSKPAPVEMAVSAPAFYEAVRDTDSVFNYAPDERHEHISGTNEIEESAIDSWSIRGVAYPQEREPFLFSERVAKFPELYTDIPEPSISIPEPFIDIPGSPGVEEKEAFLPVMEKSAEMQEPIIEIPKATADVKKYLSKSGKADKKNRAKRAADIVFYAVIAFILIAALIFSGKTDNNGFRIFHYKAFNVLTPSMEREIPQGALVITKEVDPDTIEIGDDITFIRGDSATVTHRVVNILENYNDSGIRGFETQGVANPDPDPDIVYEGNIIGVVKYSIPELGFTLTYIADNIGLVFLVLGGILVAMIALGMVFQRPKKEKAGSKAAP